MKWTTREDVKVDRVACPWLIRRFIDPDAQFEFLPKDTDWSSVTDGTLFDVPGCEFGHQLGLSNHELLNREFILYEALHAECKERSALHESK